MSCSNKNLEMTKLVLEDEIAKQVSGSLVIRAAKQKTYIWTCAPSEDSDQTKHSRYAESDVSLHFLLRKVCPNSQKKYEFILD